MRGWARDGLLLIGDAAHTMSPAGAIGVNVAIATAAVAAQELYPRLGHGPIGARGSATRIFASFSLRSSLANSSRSRATALGARPFLREPAVIAPARPRGHPSWRRGTPRI
jgi:2-polyprenyl-6-methoxyphenol hydroxylase-like FAD-dependent oxidoreductase